MSDPLQGARVGINAVPLLTPLTGIGQYTLHLAREMQTLLREPWFFYASDWSREIRDAPAAPRGGIVASIKSLVPRAYEIARWRQQRHFTSGVRAHGIGLYHETNYMAFPFDGPTVVTVHDLSWVRHPETHPADRVRMMDKTMPGVLERATQVIADSEFTRREAIEHYRVPAERVTTVLLGVPPEFRPVGASDCETFLASQGLRHGEYVLAVGTLEPRKNLATAVAAFARLPQALRARYPLVVAGMAGWRMERLPSGMQRMIAAGEVRLQGYVPQQDLPKLYSSARLFVYPSIYEGFGLPPLEAMACGVPVIASRRASLPEVVGDAGVLVEPLDEAEIAERMRALLEDGEGRARLTAAGLARASGFTWRRCALETISVYEKAHRA